MRRLFLAIVFLLMSRAVFAQDAQAFSKVYLGSAPCTLSTGSGAPSSGATCDLYIDSSSGDLYTKQASGGWTIIPRLNAANSWSALQTMASASVTGNFDVNTTKFTVTAASGNTAVAGTLDVTSTLIPHTHVLPNVGYTDNLGSLSDKFLAIYGAELWVETLVAQQTIATIGGRVLVAPTNILSADLTNVATTITVKYNNLNNGDRIYMEANGSVEFMAVTSSAGGSAGVYTYTVTRNLDGSGANAWSAGDAILDTGTTGNGFIDLYSTAGVLSGSGPTIAFNKRTGTTYNQIAVRTAVGNLNGLYGYAAETYGIAMGDPSATNITVDETNGIRIRSGTTNKLVADTSGNLSLTGDLTMSTSGVFHSSGASAFGTGTGWWLDYNGGTPRFRVGNPAGSEMAWDGSTAMFKAGNVTIDGSGVVMAPGSSSTWAVTQSYSFALGAGLSTFGMYGYDDGSNSGVKIYNTSSSARTTRIDLTASTGGNAAQLLLNGSNSQVEVIASLTQFDHFYMYPGYNDAFSVNASNYIYASNAQGSINTSGDFLPLGYRGRAGTGGTIATNDFNLYYNGSCFRLYVDVSDTGCITVSSDRRLKKNIAPLDSALADVMKLRPVTFDWIPVNAEKGLQYGLIAQDVAKVFPAIARNTGFVTPETPGGTWQVDYPKLIPILIRAVQELQAQIDILKGKQ